MSRSDRIPAMRPPAPRIRTAPIRCVESSFAAADRSAVGSIQIMSPPKVRFLAARIVFTFMAASLAHDLFSGRHARAIFPAYGITGAGRYQRSRRCCSSVKTQLREARLAVRNWLMRHCSRIFELRKMWFRIKPREQEQAGQEAANVRLPGNRLLIAEDRDRADPEQDVDAKPDNQKQQHARIAPNIAKRNRRYHVGALLMASHQPQGTT